MNKTMIGLVGFIFGAATGSIVAWKYAEDKYRKIADEEITSVKELFSVRKDSDDTSELSKEDEKPEQENHISHNSYENEISTLNYNAISTKTDSDTVKKDDIQEDLPYVITPEEFDMNIDYNCIELKFYKDHILTDDFDDPIEDIEHSVGYEALKCFDNSDTDTVYVRNDKREVDYEIIRDPRTYHEAHDEEAV